MRLVSFDTPAGPLAALLRDGRVYDIWGEAFAGVPHEERTILALLQGGLLPEVTAVEDDGDYGVWELHRDLDGTTRWTRVDHGNLEGDVDHENGGE